MVNPRIKSSSWVLGHRCQLEQEWWIVQGHWQLVWGTSCCQLPSLYLTEIEMYYNLCPSSTIVHKSRIICRTSCIYCYVFQSKIHSLLGNKPVHMKCTANRFVWIFICVSLWLTLDIFLMERVGFREAGCSLPPHEMDKRWTLKKSRSDWLGPCKPVVLLKEDTNPIAMRSLLSQMASEIILYFPFSRRLRLNNISFLLCLGTMSIYPRLLKDVVFCSWHVSHANCQWTRALLCTRSDKVELGLSTTPATVVLIWCWKCCELFLISFTWQSTSRQNTKLRIERYERISMTSSVGRVRFSFQGALRECPCHWWFIPSQVLQGISLQKFMRLIYIHEHLVHCAKLGAFESWELRQSPCQKIRKIRKSILIDIKPFQ